MKSRIIMILAGVLLALMSASAAPVLSRMVVTTRGGDTFLFPLTAQLSLHTDGSSLHISSTDGSATLRIANVANIRYDLEQEPVMLPGPMEKPLPPLDPFPWPGDDNAGDSTVGDETAGAETVGAGSPEIFVSEAGLEVSAPGDAFLEITSLNGRTLYRCEFRDSVRISRALLQEGYVVATINGRHSFKMALK